MAARFAAALVEQDSKSRTAHGEKNKRPLQKIYEVDMLECTHCGATMCIVALIDDASTIERIL